MQNPVEKQNSQHPADQSYRPIQASEHDRLLVEILSLQNAIEPLHLYEALAIRRGRGGQLKHILLANGWVTPEDLADAQSQIWQTVTVDFTRIAKQHRLIDRLGATFCLKHRVIPYRLINGTVCIATSDPDGFAPIRRQLSDTFGEFRITICSDTALETTIASHCVTDLVQGAETSVKASLSCRSFRRTRYLIGSILALLLTATGAWYSPHLAMMSLLFVIGIALMAQTGLRLICLISAIKMAPQNDLQSDEKDAILAMFDAKTAPLPVISVLVPLYREADIVPTLIANLSRLNYPRDLTDIVIITEEDDKATISALQAAELPQWMRVISVPGGTVKTKPRALSYALNFCRGEVIGILDAEDRPEADQLHQVARRFFLAPRSVGCLQGKLDYFNPKTNWLSRCFTIEYAAWFRVMLPAFARLGLAIPLGGTTCYFRRTALESVGAWDAWNVTEDADLGVRLNRQGWKTEIIDTVTEEEPNCRTLPWIRQRSRWLKGYAMTYTNHMRTPIQLWRDLGAKRFVGFQLQFLTLLTQFLIAPVLWGFWLLFIGLPYAPEQPLYSLLGVDALVWMFLLCITSEVLGFMISLHAIRGKKHRHLRNWVPTMHFYFPLATVAAWKAAYELFARPFYWDKTPHGVIASAAEVVKLPFHGQIGEAPPASVARQTAPQPDYTSVKPEKRRA